MTLTIDLPAEVERQLRAEAANKGQAPEELASRLIQERFKRIPEQAGRVAALLDQWDAEDEANPEPGPVLTPPRSSFRVPDVG